MKINFKFLTYRNHYKNLIGKGTQCERISKLFQYTHIDAGDLLRCELARGNTNGIMIDNMIRAGQIVPVEVTLELLKNTMAGSGSNKFLIDGFPRAIDQAKAVIYVDVPDKVLEHRLMLRDQSVNRSDVVGIKKRLAVYQSQSVPVIDFYARQGIVRRVPGAVGTPDEVFTHIRSAFQRRIIFGKNYLHSYCASSLN